MTDSTPGKKELICFVEHYDNGLLGRRQRCAVKDVETFFCAAVVLANVIVGTYTGSESVEWFYWIKE